MAHRPLLWVVLGLLVAPPNIALAQALTPLRESLDAKKARITIFADGTARTLLTEGKQAGGEAGSGAIGAHLRTTNWSLRLNVNAATSADSVKSGFGAFLLNPAVGTSSGGVEVERNGVFGPPGIAARAYWTVSTAVWADTLSASNVTMNGVGFLIVGSVNGKDDEDDIYSMRFHGGVAYRAIGGDVSDEDGLRTRTLGTVDTSFWGLEGGAQMSLRNVTAGVNLNYLFDPKEGQVNGLTGFQATFAINIYGPLMSKDLTLFK